MGSPIDQDLSAAFYDLTTTGQTDFDDDVRADGLAKYVRIERQFMLSLFQTSEGLHIANEVRSGNAAEVKPLLPMIWWLLAHYPLERLGLIADRELLRSANIEELEKTHAQLNSKTYEIWPWSAS